MGWRYKINACVVMFTARGAKYRQNGKLYENIDDVSNLDSIWLDL